MDEGRELRLTEKIARTTGSGELHEQTRLIEGKLMNQGKRMVCTSA